MQLCSRRQCSRPYQHQPPHHHTTRFASVLAPVPARPQAAYSQRNSFGGTETKVLTLHFQKRQLLGAIKTSIAIVAAAGLNLLFFVQVTSLVILEGREGNPL